MKQSTAGPALFDRQRNNSRSSFMTQKGMSFITEESYDNNEENKLPLLGEGKNAFKYSLLKKRIAKKIFQSETSN